MNRRDFMQLSGMAALSGLTPAWPALAGAAGTEAPGVAPVDRDRHIRQFIPDFLDDYVRQMAFPLSFADHPFPDFEAWKREARAKSLELMSEPYHVESTDRYRRLWQRQRPLFGRLVAASPGGADQRL
jgi:hypothetical protein